MKKPRTTRAQFEGAGLELAGAGSQRPSEPLTWTRSSTTAGGGIESRPLRCRPASSLLTLVPWAGACGDLDLDLDRGDLGRSPKSGLRRASWVEPSLWGWLRLEISEYPRGMAVPGGVEAPS